MLYIVILRNSPTRYARSIIAYHLTFFQIRFFIHIRSFPSSSSSSSCNFVRGFRCNGDNVQREGHGRAIYIYRLPITDALSLAADVRSPLQFYPYPNRFLSMFNLIGILFTRTYKFLSRLLERKNLRATSSVRSFHFFAFAFFEKRAPLPPIIIFIDTCPTCLRNYRESVWFIAFEQHKRGGNLIRPSHVCCYASKKFNPFNRLSEAAVAR